MSNIIKVRLVYNEVEYESVEKTIEPVELSNIFNSETSLNVLLNAVLDLLEEAKTRYDLDEDAICQYEFFDEKGALIEYEDYITYFTVVCDASVKFPSLHEKLLSFVQRSYDEESEERFWENDDAPAGQYISSSLALYDKKYIIDFIEFLRTCDMDHEVDQGACIDKIVNKYEYNDEILTLVIARVSSALGQHGDAQFTKLLENGLMDYIKENFDLFLKKLAEEHLYSPLKFLYPDYNGFWQPGNMKFAFIDVLLENLDDEDIEKFRVFCKERLS